MIDYKKSYGIFCIGSIGGFVVTFLGLWLSMKTGAIGAILSYVGMALMLCGIVQALIFYRCPQCKKLLNMRGRKPNHCPQCGFKLELP